MRSKSIHPTSSRKSVAGNAFSDISFLYHRESFTVIRRCLSPNYADVSLHVRIFDHITTSGLKSDVIFEFSASVFLQRSGHFGRAILFSTTLVTIMSAHAP